MNEYRIGHINTLLSQKKLLKKSLKEYLGISNDTTVHDICAGKDIYISRLVMIADFIGVPVAEFFLFNGKKEDSISSGNGEESLTQYLVRQIVDSEMVARKIQKECGQDLRDKEVECMRRMHDQQLEYEREIAKLRSELNVAKAQLEMMKNGIMKTGSPTPSKLYSMGSDNIHSQAAEP